MKLPKTREELNELIAIIKNQKAEWLCEFKVEFSRRTGISWNDDAGHTNEDALRYFPEDVTEVVTGIIEKYGLFDEQ